MKPLDVIILHTKQVDAIFKEYTQQRMTTIMFKPIIPVWGRCVFTNGSTGMAIGRLYKVVATSHNRLIVELPRPRTRPLYIACPDFWLELQ